MTETPKTVNQHMCGHPELVLGPIWNVQTNQLEMAPKPPPAAMVGRCEHNMGCPVCGFGWGCSPDPCDFKTDDQRGTDGL